MHVFYIFWFRLSCLLKQTKDRPRLNVSHCIGHCNATRLQILVLCSLMQKFIMAMLELHSIIDFFVVLLSHRYMDGGWGKGRAEVLYKCLCLDWVLWLNCHVISLNPSTSPYFGWIHDYSIMASYPFSFSSILCLANHLPHEVTIALILECLFVCF